METLSRIKNLARRGPFTAQPGEAWVDADLVAEREAEMLDCLQGLVCQFAGGEKGRFDSMAISALAEAMRLLAASGRMVIEHEHGRRVLARMV